MSQRPLHDNQLVNGCTVWPRQIAVAIVNWLVVVVVMPEVVVVIAAPTYNVRDEML